jgi:hypothetical protein
VRVASDFFFGAAIRSERSLVPTERQGACGHQRQAPRLG